MNKTVLREDIDQKVLASLGDGYSYGKSNDTMHMSLAASSNGLWGYLGKMRVELSLRDLKKMRVVRSENGADDIMAFGIFIFLGLLGVFMLSVLVWGVITDGVAAFRVIDWKFGLGMILCLVGLAAGVYGLFHKSPRLMIEAPGVDGRFKIKPYSKDEVVRFVTRVKELKKDCPILSVTPIDVDGRTVVVSLGNSYSYQSLIDKMVGNDSIAVSKDRLWGNLVRRTGYHAPHPRLTYLERIDIGIKDIAFIKAFLRYVRIGLSSREKEIIVKADSKADAEKFVKKVLEIRELSRVSNCIF